MNKLKRVLLTLTLLVVASAGYGAEHQSCGSQTTLSGFIADTFYQDPDALVSSMRKTPFNTIATTVAWSVAEPQKGHVDLSAYIPRFDALVRSGYCLIILIDTSGRIMNTDVARMLGKNSIVIPATSQPDWVTGDASIGKSVDFSGNQARELDFSDDRSLAVVQQLYKSLLPQLRARYGNSILAVAPCIMQECEIKYAQEGFRWQSYSKKAAQGFRAQLVNVGIKASDMPIMNFANKLSSGNPRLQPQYPELQNFREQTIRSYVCPLAQTIRANGLHSMAYFGQVFAFTDGIYATGVIERLPDCFDIAAVDYNFYNGYGVEHKPEIPSFLTDYALSLGYKKVLVGLYMERFRDPKSLKIAPKGYATLRESIKAIRPDKGVAGFEVGNLTPDELKSVHGLREAAERVQNNSNQSGKRVAVYASIANSYLWQGDWSNNRQIVQDDLVSTFNFLQSMKGLRVDIVTDMSIEKDGLTQYSLVVLPHVSAMPATSRAAIVKYMNSGGRLISDMRTDEYKPDGEIQTDMSLRKLLGISATQAVSGDIRLVDGIVINQQNQYVNGFLLTPERGYRIAYPTRTGNGEGLILRGKNTTVFGFLPLLVEGPRGNWARRQFASEIYRLAR